MRVQGLNEAAPSEAPIAFRPTGIGTIRVGEDKSALAIVSTTRLRTVWFALQGDEGAAAEKRKRAVRRGHSALDALDAVKLGLLDGSLEFSTIGRLKSVAEGLKQSSGNNELDAILGEIELRVEVELAKATRTGKAAQPAF